MSAVVDEIESIFAPQSPLSFSHGYEYRTQQRAMATYVADAIEENHHLLIEAPTGVGKSLAYLLPAALVAVRDERKGVISTHTKNLQDQLFSKDIPIVENLLEVPLRTAVMKGRRNYLCSTRLRHVLSHAGTLLESKDDEHLQRIAGWAKSTKSGDIEKLGFVPSARLWQQICSEQEICTPRKCGMDCFYQRVRDQVRNAHIVIMNHALFFTLLPEENGDDGVLFQNDFVIFDEAQTVEAAAVNCFEERLSFNTVLGTLHRAFNSRTKKGLLSRLRQPQRNTFLSAEKAAEDFFGNLRLAVSSGGERDAQKEFRVTSPGIVPNNLEQPLDEIQLLLEKKEKIADETEATELNAIRNSLSRIQNTVEVFLSQKEPSHCYWVEMKDEHSSLCYAPVEVADLLRERLFRKNTTVVMTSATLSVNGSLDYFRQRIGADDAETRILDSPFPLDKQMRLCVPMGMPGPDEAGYSAALPSWILHSVERSKGGALVLFTNTRLMKEVAEKVRDEIESHGLQLLVQDGRISRNVLLEVFRKDVHSVLFGLESFWSGIDVPGESLRHVIIIRLPFPVPSHPMSQARMELLTGRGENSFTSYALPEAILKFRQGAGRLIRKNSDSGVITILDSRVMSRSYGRSFVSSLARCPVDIMRPDGSLEEWIEPSP